MWGILKIFGIKEKSKKESIEVRKRKNIVRDEEFYLRKSISNLERREVKGVDTSLFSKGKKNIDYENLLNEEQKKALLSTEGQFLVIAGAGSGKTRTIVYRTAWLMENGVNPEDILMITFTRKACEEMRERLQNILKVEELKTPIMTFHSFCAKLIYKYKNLFHISEINILEESDREKILELILKRYNFRKKYKNGFYTAEELVDKFLKIQNKKLRVEDVFPKDERFEDLLLVKSEYRKYKKSKNLYEFDDFIELVVKKFKEDRIFLEKIREKIKYLVIDEYQDSNSNQRELLKLLIGENKNLMVVGDDYQSIYGFRGADFTNILKFGEDFPKGRLIKLEKNYRSTFEIIEYTNKIANRFKLKYNKEILGIGNHGERVHINSFKDEEKEGKYICERIVKLKELIPYEEMAILFRNRYTVKVLEKLLQEYGIPYHKKEDEKRIGVSFYTVHSAKGLEWEAVFIPTLLEGIFPSHLEGENLEEEKRLYYVACSRAKKYLYLTYPKFHYEKLGYYDRKSKFLEY